MLKLIAVKIGLCRLKWKLATMTSTTTTVQLIDFAGEVLNYIKAEEMNPMNETGQERSVLKPFKS